MRRLIISLCATLNLLCATLKLSAASWYLDNAATGSNSGLSWANAWTNFNAVVWGSVSDNDTLFISGGSTTKTYHVTNAYHFELLKPITLRIGQDSGHNGTAIMDGLYSTGVGSVLKFYGLTGVVIDGEYNGSRHMVWQNMDTNVDSEASIVEAALSSDFTIRYVDFLRSPNGIGATAGLRGVIEHCRIMGIQDDFGIRFNGRNSTTNAYDQTFVQNCEIQLNSAMSGDGSGPDGIQGCWGLTVRSNLIYNALGVVATLPNHCDFVQGQAAYVKIYANDLLNISDSAIDFDGSGVLGNIYIYNNLVRMTYTAGIPSGIRLYSGGAAITLFTNIFILNNTFVDTSMASVGGYPIGIGYGSSGNPAVANVKIQNNIFYNCGKAGARAVMNIPASSGATAADWGIDYNLVNAGAGGETLLTVDGSSYTQDNPRTGAPVFESYSQGSAGNDLHLDTSDTVATGQGVDLSAFITTDKDGVTRAAPWDIGAYAANAASATEFFASPTGSAANSGLSTNSPWTMAYALANAGASNTIHLMAGTYTNMSLTTPSLHNGLTIHALSKWTAKILGTTTNHGFTTEAGVSNVVVDGLQIAYSYLDGVKFNSSGSTVRNCWIHHSAHGNPAAVTNSDESFSGQGVYSSHNLTTIEYSLIEDNGKWLGHDHGCYISGTNNVIRGNVFRNNLAFGIQLYTGTAGKRVSENHVYNNLIYGNGTGNGGKNGFVVWGAPPSTAGDTTNYFYGNTILGGTNYYCIVSGNGTLCVTNNLILGPNYDGEVIQAFGEPSTIICAYNLSHAALHSGDGVVNGGNNITSTTANFAGAAGRYWLAAGSPARGAALAGVAGPVDWFGNAQSTVTDLGAVQYSAALALDGRVLEPTPLAGADYWGEPVRSRIINARMLILR